MWVIIVICVLYVLSWPLHPNRACPNCKGAGRFYGALHRSKFRFCHACEGRGRVPRTGAVVLVRMGWMKDPARTGSLGWLRKNRGH